MRLAGSFGATASVTRERMRQIAAKRDEEGVKSANSRDFAVSMTFLTAASDRSGRGLVLLGGFEVLCALPAAVGVPAAHILSIHGDCRRLSALQWRTQSSLDSLMLFRWGASFEKGLC